MAGKGKMRYAVMVTDNYHPPILFGTFLGAEAARACAHTWDRVINKGTEAGHPDHREVIVVGIAPPTAWWRRQRLGR